MLLGLDKRVKSVQNTNHSILRSREIQWLLYFSGSILFLELNLVRLLLSRSCDSFFFTPRLMHYMPLCSCDLFWTKPACETHRARQRTSNNTDTPLSRTGLRLRWVLWSLRRTERLGYPPKVHFKPLVVLLLEMADYLTQVKRCNTTLNPTAIWIPSSRNKMDRSGEQSGTITTSPTHIGR